MRRPNAKKPPPRVKVGASIVRGEAYALTAELPTHAGERSSAGFEPRPPHYEVDSANLKFVPIRRYLSAIPDAQSP